MAKRSKQTRKPRKPCTKGTNGAIDAQADFDTLRGQLGALQQQHAQLSQQLNQVSLAIAKTEGTMEYLTQRGAKVPGAGAQPEKEKAARKPVEAAKANLTE